MPNSRLQDSIQGDPGSSCRFGHSQWDALEACLGPSDLGPKAVAHICICNYAAGPWV